MVNFRIFLKGNMYKSGIFLQKSLLDVLEYVRVL